MIKIGGALDKEYPKEQVLKCQASYNNIMRERKPLLRAVRHMPTLLELESPKPLLRAVRHMPTLLELESPKLFEFYDTFEVSKFTFQEKENTGHLKVDISLLKQTENLEIKAQILDLDSQTVVAEITPEKAENTTTLTLEEDFQVTENSVKSLGVIAYGKWGDSNPEENELSIFREANTQDPGVTYDHTYPKKEKSAVTLGTLDPRFAPDPKAKGDSDHIVIALIRSPQDTTDIDYICGAGRDSKSRPMLCVPGVGEFTFPVGETVSSDKDHPNTAVCKLYRKSGGAAVIAAADYSTNQIKLTANGRNCTYEFLAWGDSYTDPGAWVKTEFDYCLDLVLHTQRDDKTWKEYSFTIDTRNLEESITDEVKALQIMYGCMAPDTEIAMLDGGTKQIRDIHMGDKVKGKNGEGMLVENIWTGPEMNQMIKISVAELENPLLLTETHPVLTQDAAGKVVWKRAGACSQDDRVLVCNSQGGEAFCPITAVEKVEPCDLVYNLDLKPCGNPTESQGTMYCNGILTGDNRMQNSDLEG